MKRRRVVFVKIEIGVANLKDTFLGPRTAVELVLELICRYPGWFALILVIIIVWIAASSSGSSGGNSPIDPHYSRPMDIRTLVFTLGPVFAGIGAYLLSRHRKAKVLAHEPPLYVWTASRD
jgi:hypothetical protein